MGDHGGFTILVKSLSLAFFRQKLRKLGHNSCYKSNNSTFFEIRREIRRNNTWTTVYLDYQLMLIITTGSADPTIVGECTVSM